MSDVISEFTVRLEQVSDFEFRVIFDNAEHPELMLDEPPPLGKDQGPNAGRLLAASIANCLSASFLFAARKAKLGVGGIKTEAKVGIIRNENRRLRIGKIEVELDPGLGAADQEQAAAVAAAFEDFCTITQSVRQGIPVQVRIKGLAD
jgi:organic hydroperoxide reductase OsmC/OhrA